MPRSSISRALRQVYCHYDVEIQERLERQGRKYDDSTEMNLKK